MKKTLSNKFYTKEAIEEAAEEFRNFCECTILNEKFEIEIKPKEEGADKIADEFCNFVLGITKDKALF